MRGATGRSRQTGVVPSCHRMPRVAAVLCAGRLTAVLMGGLMAGLMARHAAAFPASDASNPSVVSPATAATPDQSDVSALQHQLSLLNPYSASVGPGWTFTPSLTLQEAFNDNVFQTQQDRRWDLITYVTPGLAIYGDTQNVQLRFNYAPSLIYYARNSSLDQLAQNLNAIADVTLWQDHLYLDVRASVGEGAASGSNPGLGFGGGGLGQINTNQPNVALNGLTKNNSSQYTSFAASPYFLQSFGDYGSMKLGYTLSHSTSSNAAGFVPLPTNTQGPTISQTSNEELATYTTGQWLERVSDTVTIDLNQYGGSGNGTTGHSNTASNQVNYVVNRAISVFASIGYESIDYTGGDSRSVNDMTWQVGTTLTPDPKSTLSLSYGHQQGIDSLSANGVYQVTARTSVNLNYGETIGTQLQQLQTQLAIEDINNVGTLVNSRTGQPITNASQLLGTQNQLYKSQTATVGSSTLLDRDTITVNLQYAVYTAAGAGATGATSGVTGTATWTHTLSEDLSLSASGSYGWRWFIEPGGTNKFTALSAVLNYAISATVSTSLSYAFYDLNSTQAGQSEYQDIIILSLTKTF
jgi:uncharacterized protein (PEP-CTERM system associated)